MDASGPTTEGVNLYFSVFCLARTRMITRSYQSPIECLLQRTNLLLIIKEQKRSAMSKGADCDWPQQNDLTANDAYSVGLTRDNGMLFNGLMRKESDRRSLTPLN